MDEVKTRVDGGAKAPHHPAAVRRQLNDRLIQLAEREDLSSDSLNQLLDILDTALETAPIPPSGRPPPAERAAETYEVIEEIGVGGVGAVWQVWDPVLQRKLAMKVLLPEHSANPDLVEAFLEEARLVASLDHPAIIPIYSVGRLPEHDGRVYFTMRQVTGGTFSDLIEEVHRRGPPAEGRLLEPLRRLLRLHRSICSAVGFAHQRGVLHGDLKPANVMVGELGEVYVVDWGLARIVESAEGPGWRARSASGAEVQGTPLYMAPELLQPGAQISTATEIYALGTILYQVLAGRPPYTGSYDAVTSAIQAGPPPPVDSAFEVPPELARICRRAMARDPEDRYPRASELAEELGAWLEGTRRLAEARLLVHKSDRMSHDAAKLREQAIEHQTRADAVLRDVPGHAPEAHKLLGWRLEDSAEALEQEAHLKEAEAVQLLRDALLRVPDFVPAHRRLAQRFLAEHKAAEDAGNTAAAARYEMLLRRHDRSSQHAAYLDGRGRLDLVTDRPVRVELFRYELQNRRLVLQECEHLGETPIINCMLPRGSYLALLETRDGQSLRYPFCIHREDRWPTPPPERGESPPIHIPEDLGSHCVYVPEGWFGCGGDPWAYGAPLARDQVWVDGFFIERFPVTNARFIAFLDDLLRQGREEEALRWVPRERAGPGQDHGALLYGRHGDGSFFLQTDADGHTWNADWPVLMIPAGAAEAYARWRAERDGLPWRLPWELEWEKAARGVDGRRFPWGNQLDPTWCAMRESSSNSPQPAVVDSYPVDESPYGVRGMAGNAYDWCADDYSDTGPVIGNGRWHRSRSGSSLRVVRGGSWDSAEGKCRSAYRSSARADTRSAVLSFRLACSPPKDPS